MSKKLLADEKIAALVEREAAKAVKEDRKRIVAELKEVKQEITDTAETSTQRVALHKIVAAASRIVRDAA